MTSKKKRLQNLRLYGVTNLLRGDQGELDRIAAALSGGVDAIQLRSKCLSDRALLVVGKKIKQLAIRSGALFFVNDRLDLCRALGADGVHLGQEDLPISFARKWLGSRALIGKSTHSLEQAREAQREPLDYIGCGPIFSTPTKPDYESVGLSLIGKVMAISQVPVICIGGIDEENIMKVIAHGGERVAVVRALFDVKDPAHAAKQLKKKWLGATSS